MSQFLGHCSQHWKQYCYRIWHNWTIIFNAYFSLAFFIIVYWLTKHPYLIKLQNEFDHKVNQIKAQLGACSSLGFKSEWGSQRWDWAEHDQTLIMPRSPIMCTPTNFKISPLRGFSANLRPGNGTNSVEYDRTLFKIYELNDKYPG